MDTPPINSMETALEHILASMARFESRLDEKDRRIVENIPHTRPEPELPYTISSDWNSDSGFPGYNPTAGVAVSIPSFPQSSGRQFHNPISQPWRTHRIVSTNGNFIPRPPLGFASMSYATADHHTQGIPLGFSHALGPSPY